MKFSVLLPTTGDRAALVELAIGSALAQTLTDFQLIVIGDGLSPQSEARIGQVCATDPRLRLVSFPKHERRGEIYRHQVLGTVNGDAVAYLLDRDLWLAHHLETLGALLAKHDFGHTGMVAVEADGRMHRGIECRLQLARHRRWVQQYQCPIGMSTVGHRLAAYRALPYGWRTTPPGRKTDHYMWQQFLDQPGLSAGSTDLPTVLYFERGGHPGPPVAARQAELAQYAARLPEFNPAAIASLTGHWRQRWRRRLRSILWWRPRLSRWVLCPYPLIKHGTRVAAKALGWAR